MMERCLLIGDINDELHAISGVAEEFRRIFDGLMTVEIADESQYYDLPVEKLLPYYCVIFMPARWRRDEGSVTTLGLVSYVARGGNLLSVHHGLIADGCPEIEILHSAAFSGHADYGSLDYEPVQGNPLARGVSPVTLLDEPYLFCFDALVERHTLLTMRYGNMCFPAAWTRAWGKGQVVCVAPGHDRRSVSGLGQMFRNIAEYFVGTGRGGNACEQ